MAQSDWTVDHKAGDGVNFGVARVHTAYSPNLASSMSAGAQCRGCIGAGVTINTQRGALTKTGYQDLPAATGTISIRAAVRANTLTGTNHAGVIMHYKGDGTTNPFRRQGVYFGTPATGSGDKLQIDFLLPNGNNSTASGCPVGAKLVDGYTVGQWVLVRIDKVRLTDTTARYDFYSAPPSDSPTWTLRDTYSPVFNWKSPGADEWPNGGTGVYLNDNAAGIGRMSAIDCVKVVLG